MSLCVCSVSNNIRTPRSFEIIRRAERQFLHERITFINNPINISRTKRDTCIDQLVCVLDRDTLKECQVFINRVMKARNVSLMERQKSKFYRLWHKITGDHSNINGKQGSGGNPSGYMCKNYGGHSSSNTTSKPSISNNSTATTAITTTTTSSSPCTPVCQVKKQVYKSIQSLSR